MNKDLEAVATAIDDARQYQTNFNDGKWYTALVSTGQIVFQGTQEECQERIRSASARAALMADPVRAGLIFHLNYLFGEHSIIAGQFPEAAKQCRELLRRAAAQTAREGE